MNFSCPACQAKYFVRDEDVIGRTLKLRCHRCKGDIPIQGRRQALNDPAGPRRAISSDRLRLSLPLELSAARAVAEVAESAPSSVRRSLPPPLPADVDPGEFHVGIAGRAIGPLGMRELEDLAQQGKIGPRTYVWRPGLAAWARLTEIPEFEHLVLALSVPAPASPPVPVPSPGKQTLEERLGFGYLGEVASPTSSRPPHAERRVRLAPSARPAPPAGEWRSLLVGLMISLALGVALGAMF